MKLLLDSCISGKTLPLLQSAGHDVIWAGNWERDPGDSEILARAFHEERVLITLDKDFGELAIVKGEKHTGVVRLVNFPAKQQGPACLSILDRYADELQAGAIVTVETNRVRIRPSEQDQ